MTPLDASPPDDVDVAAVARMVERAAAAVAVGPPMPLPQALSPTIDRPSRRRLLVVLAAAAAIATAVLFANRPWDQGSAAIQVATGGSPSDSSTTTGVLGAPWLGSARVVDAGMEGVNLPAISLPEDMVAPSGGLSPPLGWSFTPPSDWAGASKVSVTGSGSGGLVLGFVESEDGRRSVAMSYSVSSVGPEPGADALVQARDGTPWTVRSLDADGAAVVAISLPLDGNLILLFTGLTREEWQTILSSSASSSVGNLTESGDTPAALGQSGPNGLPADLRDRWRVTPNVNKRLVVGGPDGRTYEVHVTSGTAPEGIEQRVTAASQLVGDAALDLKSRQAVVLDSACDSTSGTEVCGRLTQISGDGHAISGAFLSAWRDGTRVDVEVQIEPSSTPIGAEALMDEMGEVIKGILPEK